MRRLRIVPQLLLSGLTLALVGEARAAPLDVDDLFRSAEFQHRGGVAAFSPDGGWIASTVVDRGKFAAQPGGEADVSKGGSVGSMGADIWLTSAAAGAPRNLTNGVGNSWGPAWSPDGSLLAFYSDRDGQPNAWVWERSTDTFRKPSAAITRTFYGSEVPIWTPDSRRLIVPVEIGDAIDPHNEIVRGSWSVGQSPRDQSPPSDREPGSTVKVSLSPRTQSDAQDSNFGTNTPVADIAVIDLTTGGTSRIVHRVHGRARKYLLSPDGRSLAYLDAQPRTESVAIWSLMVVDLRTGKRRTLVPRIVQRLGDAVSWSPDSKHLAYIAEDVSIKQSAGRRSRGDLFVVSAAGGAAHRYEQPRGIFDSSKQPPLWDEKGRHIYIIGANQIWRATPGEQKAEPITDDATYEKFLLLSASDRNRVWSPDDHNSLIILGQNTHTKKSAFIKVDLGTGRSSIALEAPKTFGSDEEAPVVSPDGRLMVYVVSSAASSPDLWMVDAKFRQSTRLTTINPHLEKYRFGLGQLIEFRSHDGTPLRGTLVLPADYEPGRRYPTVVEMYPGMMGSAGVNGFSLTEQLVVTRGFAKLYPDMPVQTGTPMQDLMKAVMPAIDRAVELGITDPDRVAVTGQSGGGYAALALIVQSKRFRAAVMNAGFYDIVNSYAWNPAWLEELEGAIGAAPWKAPQLYVSNSPAFYIDRIQTPLLIQAGAADTYIVRQSDELFGLLERMQKIVTYIRYEDEGHVLGAPVNLRDYWKRVFAFYGEHLDLVFDSEGAIVFDGARAKSQSSRSGGSMMLRN